MNKNSVRPFKTYSRGQRELSINETFNKGIVFSRAPLDTEKMRLLVNYDIIDDGESLRVRDGIRPTARVTGGSSYVSRDRVLYSRDAIKEDGKTYRTHLLTSRAVGTQVSGSHLYDKAASFIYTNLAQSSVGTDGLDVYNYNTLSLGNILAYKPQIAKTNGMPLTSDTDRMRPIVGFGWDDNMYYFKRDGILYRTVYNTSNATHTVQALTPKTLTPIEAMSSGFNMLASNPYEFHNTVSGDAKLSFSGLLIYDKDTTTIQTTPMVGVEYTIRAFYTAKTNSKYNIVFSYKAKDTDEYIVIKEEYVTFSSANTELKCNFTCPIQDAIIQVAAYAPNLAIKQHPVSTYKAVNSTAEFSTIVFTGPDLTVSYKWQYSTNSGATWTDCTDTGYNTSTLKVTVTQDKDNYLYHCVITDTAYDRTLTTVSAKLHVSTESVTVSPIEDSTSEDKWAPDYTAFNRISVAYGKDSKSAVANKALPNYNLWKAGGIVYWKNYLWLYGNVECPNTIFRSQINEPAYFPYPNGVDIFDEPVLKMIPFNDTMLVFTSTQIVQITLAETGWTKKVLQSNLDFNDYNVDLIQLVKNMVFFQSGDYYYMIVPKTLSLQNELAIAPVSKNIEYFLDNFTANITELLQSVYEFDDELVLACHYNYLNYEDVHNVYTFDTGDTYLNVDLLYSTTDRHWRIYTYQSRGMYMPLKQDATKSSILVSTYKNSDTDGIQYLYPDSESCEDAFLRNTDGVLVTPTYKNWQFLDTGYRDDSVDLNKRYRELQIKFNNVSTSNLYFHTEFVLDGSERIGRYVYKTEQNLDPTSDEYGFVTITRVPIPENLQLPTITETPGSTVLGTSENDWVLDLSAFPEVAFWKARLKISGKGYTPRFRIRCESDRRYEILGYTWVYRMMYAR